VHRDADGAGLVGDGPGDGLANPPGRVGAEFVAALVLELVHRFHQADVAFLDQVEEGHAAVGVFLADADHQAQVGFDQFHLGLVDFLFFFFDGVDEFGDLVGVQPGVAFDLVDFALRQQQAAFGIENRRRGPRPAFSAAGGLRRSLHGDVVDFLGRKADFRSTRSISSRAVAMRRLRPLILRAIFMISLFLKWNWRTMSACSPRNSSILGVMLSMLFSVRPDRRRRFSWPSISLRGAIFSIRFAATA
jgi:hypothetical protein